MKNKVTDKNLRSKTFDIVVACACFVVVVNTFLIIMSLYNFDIDVYPVTFILLCVVFLLNLMCFVLVVIMRRVFNKRIKTKLAEPVIHIKSDLEMLLKGEFTKPESQEISAEMDAVYDAIETIRLKLEEYNEQQRVFKEAKHVYISGLMHDIATPVTRISGCASMINDGMVTDSQDIKKFAELIIQNTEDINIMLKNLAEIEKYNEAVIHNHMLPINLASVLERYTKDLQLELAKQNVTILFVNKCDTEPVCMLDVKSCKRVLMNLINNSIKYKKPESECKIVMSLSAEGDEVLFAFADNGIGVEEGTQEKLFDMFYRADSARHNVTDGNGVGLFVSSEIIKSNNGKIWADNNGDGLTVFITLPKTDAQPVEWFD